MRMLLTALILCSAFSTGAFAAEDTDKLLVDALISRQTQKQIGEFNQLVEHVRSIQFDSANDVDTITLVGMIIHGGDIACGTATLKIVRTFKRSWNGMGLQAVYQADVTKDEVPGCR